MTHRTQNIFHTQSPFSVLTLLAFGYEKYYICTEIWEEPRLPPFFVTFPLKTGVLEAHPGKIMRRVGKIGRQKVFSKVKYVNVESLKNCSKLLDF